MLATKHIVVFAYLRRSSEVEGGVSDPKVADSRSILEFCAGEVRQKQTASRFVRMNK